MTLGERMELARHALAQGLAPLSHIPLVFPFRKARSALDILDHRTRMVLAFGVSPSPTAEAALEVWERAKAFIQERTGRKPKALVHHDQGGAFLSHEWVGRLLLEDGQRVSYSLMGPRGNPVMESFFARFKGENRDLFLACFPEVLSRRETTTGKHQAAKDLRELKGVIDAFPSGKHL